MTELIALEIDDRNQPRNGNCHTFCVWVIFRQNNGGVYDFFKVKVNFGKKNRVVLYKKYSIEKIKWKKKIDCSNTDKIIDLIDT
jgi:hypothetical protein